MTYKKINKVGSPRLHLLNLLREKNIYSEFEKKWFTKIDIMYGYYFSQELLDNDFDFENSINWKTSKEFMETTWYSRPKINTYIEKHWRVLYLDKGYYDLEVFKEFLKWHIKMWIEKRGRPKKD